jgi:hypothetical protein
MIEWLSSLLLRRLFWYKGESPDNEGSRHL